MIKVVFFLTIVNIFIAVLVGKIIKSYRTENVNGLLHTIICFKEQSVVCAINI